MLSKFSNYQEAIIIFKAKIKLDWCANIINYMDDVCIEKAKIVNDLDSKNDIDLDSRNVYSHFLETNIKKEAIYMKYINQLCKEIINDYSKKFKYINHNMSLFDCTLLKYEKDNFYETHTDDHPSFHRSLSIIFNLNQNYRGGELSFTNPISESYDLKYNLNAGDIIVFPSNFLYPHSILPIKEGVRYSIVVWAN